MVLTAQALAAALVFGKMVILHSHAAALVCKLLSNAPCRRRCPTSTQSAESDFLAAVLSEGAHARDLSVDFASVIASAYELNWWYRRAFWINPG